MRIGVNASPMLRDTAADTGNIVTTLLLGLCRLHPEHTFIFFFDQQPSLPEFPPNVTISVLPLNGNKKWQRYLWQEWKLPAALKKQGVELFIGMDGTLPLRSKIPAHLFLRDRRLEEDVLKYVNKARKVLVLSETARQELIQVVPAATVEVVSPGVPEDYQPLEWELREDVKREFAGGVEYFISVGSVHPGNNIMPLLKAFSALKRRLHSNMKLVLTGMSTAAGAEITESLASYKYRNDVVWLQETDLPTLARLVAGAYALIYTPRFDGMAMPVYGAIRSEVPVIALEGEAAKEAGGDAVIYTDPEDLEDFANKMCLLYKDETLRSRQLSRISNRQLPGFNAEGLI